MGDGLIYDRNFIPLVNEKSKYITVIANSGDITKYRSTSFQTERNLISFLPEKYRLHLKAYALLMKIYIQFLLKFL